MTFRDTSVYFQDLAEALEEVKKLKAALADKVKRLDTKTMILSK